MPEGDTIHRSARRLHRVLARRVLTSFESPRRPALEVGAPPAGSRVAAVEARGKYLLVRFEEGRTLETHMKMNGSWHLYRAGERWQGRRSEAVAVLRCEDWVAVCFLAPVCRWVRGPSQEAGRLGPDLLAPSPDLDEAIARMSGHPDLPLGVAVMRQDLVAGIGNVYKSEVLFETGLNPFAAVASVDEGALREVLRVARRHLRRNLHTRARGTRRIGGGGRLWVYDRSGRPCYRCDALIRMRRQGSEAGRSTYFCPGCQSVDVGAFSPERRPVRLNDSDLDDFGVV